MNYTMVNNKIIPARVQEIARGEVRRDFCSVALSLAYETVKEQLVVGYQEAQQTKLELVAFWYPRPDDTPINLATCTFAMESLRLYCLSVDCSKNPSSNHPLYHSSH
jgi:hypothetical protein